MAIYSLLFGHVEWPDERQPIDPIATLDLGELEPRKRLSVRVPAALKRRVEQSAALEGVPADAWVVSALSRSVDPRVLEVQR
jgi:hypothetical protein